MTTALQDWSLHWISKRQDQASLVSVDYLFPAESCDVALLASLSLFMTFAITDDNQFDEEFLKVACQLANLQTHYDHHKYEAQKVRMEMIGLAEEEKSKHPQRSPEHRYIHNGYEANAWTEDIVKKNKAAWQVYKDFLSNVNPEIQAIATESTVSHLYEFSLDTSGQMWWYAMKYMKSQKKLPSIKQLRGYRGGFTDEKFRFRNSLRQPTHVSSTPATANEAKTTTPSPHTFPDHFPNDSSPTVFPVDEPALPVTFCPSDTAYLLIQSLQQIVERLLDMRPQWEGDQRVLELVDAQRLSELTNQLCAVRDLGWDF